MAADPRIGPVEDRPRGQQRLRRAERILDREQIALARLSQLDPGFDNFAPAGCR